MDSSELLIAYFQANPKIYRMDENNSPRRWYLLDESGNKLAYLWFKVIFGWKISFYDEEMAVSMARPSIQSVEHLKEIVINHIKK
jgi:hypothetical protein